MSTTTIRFALKVGTPGVLTDADSVPVFRDPTAAYGLRRTDTNAVIVAAATPLVRISTGVYEYTFTDPAAGLTYQYWIEFVYLSATYRTEKTMAGTPSVSGTYIYAQLADIKKHNDKRLLVQLTNDDDTVDPTDATLIDENTLALAENEAATTINNFLRNVYDDLPLTGSYLTPEIVLISAKLAICNLWRRRGDEPQQVTDMRRETMARLKVMGSPVPDENLNKAKSNDMMPARLVRGKTRSIYDNAGYFDGLASQGRTTLPADTEDGH